MKKQKDSSAKAAQWGRQGGKIGGPARAAKLSKAERTAIARQGGKARHRKKQA